jgi:two-component system C4-dicarboxylate transport sensor histidine kinase DctB
MDSSDCADFADLSTNLDTDLNTVFAAACFNPHQQQLNFNNTALALLHLPCKPHLVAFTELIGPNLWQQLKQLEHGHSKLLPWPANSNKPSTWMLWTSARQGQGQNQRQLWQITEQAALGRASQLWQHQSQLATVGQVMAGICHEVNQPLNAMRLRLYGLQTMQANGAIEDLGAHLTALDEQVGRCANTLASMREMVGHQSVNLQAFDACASVEQIVQLLKSQLQQQQVQLTSHNTGQAQLVFGQAQRLEQILINLINNARDAIIGQAALTQPGALSVTLASAHKAGQAGVRISVEDNGPGIASDDQSKVFEAYYTNKDGQQGTGLGLALCRDLAHDLAGQLSLTSSPGHTKFELWLPLAAEAQTPR